MSLGNIAKVYQDIQKIRIGLSNRMWAAENADGRAVPKIYEQMAGQLKQMEDNLIKAAKDELKYHPAWTWLKQVKGLGPTLAVQLLGYIGDIARFETVSKLWKYSGLGVTDGQADRMKKGQSAGYNPRFKSLMFLIGTSFLRSNSPYRKIYDNTKKQYQYTKQDLPILQALEGAAIDPGKAPWKTVFRGLGGGLQGSPENQGWLLRNIITVAREDDTSWKVILNEATKAAKEKGLSEPWIDLRVHLTAMRKMEKIFLSHLFEKWREAEGLPPRREYVFEYLGHTTRYSPDEFVA